VAASALLFSQALGKSEWAGFGLIALGVLATVFSGTGFRVLEGDWLILGSAVVYAAVTALSKRLLVHLDLPGLVFARNFFSAIVFFVLANVIYGPDHFAEAFYGPLWIIMVVYALVVIVTAQFAWFRSLSLLTPSTIAKWTVMTPVLAMSYAFLINGEEPGRTQLVALSFVTLGILVSNVGKFTPKGVSDSGEASVSAS
jgi:drug/metabolite transporter (DMT)-like permease